MPANQGVADERYMQHDTRSSRINSKTKRPRSEIREMQCQTTAVERRDVRWKGWRALWEGGLEGGLEGTRMSTGLDADSPMRKENAVVCCGGIGGW